jgi:thioredoxin reductase (NADPH)
MKENWFDVLIIGGGPIGIACGLEAKNKGLSYLIVEKGPIVNSLYNYPVNMQFFSSSEKLEIDNIPFISKSAKPDRGEALEYYRRITSSNNLNIKLFEKVATVNKNGIFLMFIRIKVIITLRTLLWLQVFMIYLKSYILRVRN